jgi:hypothetical protein
MSKNVRIERREGLLGERKNVFVECNMTGDDHFVSREVKATVAFVLHRIPDEDARSESGSEFVRSLGFGVGKTETPKCAQMIIGWRYTKKSFVWCFVV